MRSHYQLNVQKELHHVDKYSFGMDGGGGITIESFKSGMVGMNV